MAARREHPLIVAWKALFNGFLAANANTFTWGRIKHDQKVSAGRWLFQGLMFHSANKVGLTFPDACLVQWTKCSLLRISGRYNNRDC